MHTIITALLLVKSHRKGSSDNDGNNATITLGIVSPMMTQKATMPPKALKGAELALDLFGARCLHTRRIERPRSQ